MSCCGLAEVVAIRFMASLRIACCLLLLVLVGVMLAVVGVGVGGFDWPGWVCWFDGTALCFNRYSCIFRGPCFYFTADRTLVNIDGLTP